ncbi:MAG: hypothetical protein CMA03_05175 [Euryarchaeota archaeon]|nr:hypothetical protein [Euryarchaeota archaeon]|tara:strand:+ start:1719 stop:2045 length:327 start_codon:yes stop_codon:yes gene_type:complete
MNLELIETMTNLSCGLAVFCFTIIATASRNAKLEVLVQQIISFCCVFSAFLLTIIAMNGGTFWSSENLIPPLIALNLIIMVAARINLKGKQISQGMNPHQIGRLNQEE